MGEQAFPDKYGAEGMTLRDFFAGQALVGFIAFSGGHPDDEATDKDGNKLNKTGKESYAESAYKYADAMIAERNEKEKGD